MADTMRTMLVLDADAAALLDELAPSPRKKGELVSGLIREAAARRAGESVSAQLGAVLARLSASESRLAGLEALREELHELSSRVSAVETTGRKRG